MAEHHADKIMDEVAVVDDHVTDTICKQVYALLQRMYEDGNHQAYDDAFCQIGNRIMFATTTFRPYFLALNERIMNRDYGTALQIGRAMVEHEAMLLEIAFGRFIQSGQTLN